MNVAYFTLLENRLYRTGTIIRVSIVDTSSPPIIAQPIGAHIVPPRKVNGNNPPIVVRVVRMIGVKRISPAIFSASMIDLPSFRRRFV